MTLKPKSHRARRKRPLAPVTPISRIKSSLRRLSMYSRERAQAVKNAGRCCEKCGSTPAQAHHKRRPDWKRIEAAIREELLQTPDDYTCLCSICHGKEHENDEHVFRRKP